MGTYFLIVAGVLGFLFCIAMIAKDAILNSSTLPSEGTRSWWQEAKKFAIAGGAVTALFLTIGFAMCGPGPVFAESDLSRELRQQKQARVDLVNNWLETQREGRDGGYYWSKEWYVRQKAFYSLASWEVVGTAGCGVTVLADSSTKGGCLLYTSPSPRDGLLSRMPSSA